MLEEEDEEAGDEGGPTRWSDDDGRRRRVGAEELRAAAISVVSGSYREGKQRETINGVRGFQIEV